MLSGTQDIHVYIHNDSLCGNSCLLPVFVWPVKQCQKENNTSRQMKTHASSNVSVHTTCLSVVFHASARGKQLQQRLYSLQSLKYLLPDSLQKKIITFALEKFTVFLEGQDRNFLMSTLFQIAFVSKSTMILRFLFFLDGFLCFSYFYCGFYGSKNCKHIRYILLPCSLQSIKRPL